MTHEPYLAELCSQCGDFWPCETERKRRQREQRLRDNAAEGVDAWWVRR